MPKVKALSDNCPVCSEKMEKGYLRCRGAVWGWGWVKERKPWTGFECITEAYTCQNCKFIILSSDIIES